MFAGTPQIVSDVDAIKDYVVDGVSAITVPLRAVEAVRSGINKIINDPSNAARLSENAKRYAHSWLTMTAPLSQLCLHWINCRMGKRFARR